MITRMRLSDNDDKIARLNKYQDKDNERIFYSAHVFSDNNQKSQSQKSWQAIFYYSYSNYMDQNTSSIPNFVHFHQEKQSGTQSSEYIFLHQYLRRESRPLVYIICVLLFHTEGKRIVHISYSTAKFLYFNTRHATSMFLYPTQPYEEYE